MKYICSVRIKLFIGKVVQLWENEDNFCEWQDGFIKIDHISGEPGKIDSKSQIYLEQGKRKFELIETIISNNLPDEKIALYEHVHMTNRQTTRFISISDNETEYISEVEYLKFNGFLPRIMAILFPGMFRKQSQKWLNQFKEFAEKSLES